MGALLVLLSLGFLTGIAAAAMAAMIPLWIAIGYGVVSLLIIPFYGWDKFRARRSGNRVPEKTLHLLELIGGWPGAILAQQLFRHKTKKTSFQRVFWLIVLLHLAGWGWFFNPF